MEKIAFVVDAVAVMQDGRVDGEVSLRGRERGAVELEIELDRLLHQAHPGKRVLDDNRVAIEQQEHLAVGLGDLPEGLQLVDGRDDPHLGAVALERLPEARIEPPDDTDHHLRVRQLAAEPADRLHEPQRLAEAAGIVLGDTADEDIPDGRPGLGERRRERQH
jgi:hypothetical protein